MNVHVQPLGQPAPGSAKPGNLYADLQTRSLWLGVAPAVDASGSVLISDMVALMAEIAQTEADAKAYADTGLATKAPTVHTHTSSQITDFTAAVTGVASAIPGLQFENGMIMMWSGSLAAIGVGGLAKWKLCDGSNGTPDLRDRFVIGAGNKAVGSKNLLTATAATDSQGAHNHVMSNVALTAAQIPAHSHTAGTLAGTISGTAASNGAHTHTVDGGFTVNSFAIGGGGPPTSYSNNSGANLVVGTSSNGAHTHTVSGSCDINSGSVANNVGGGGTHTHVINDNAGAHTHSVASAAIREATPYYALAFIMKVP